MARIGVIFPDRIYPPLWRGFGRRDLGVSSYPHNQPNNLFELLQGPTTRARTIPAIGMRKVQKTYFACSFPKSSIFKKVAMTRR
ncbi:MAG: hypothetical protein A4E39_00473 [Methanoregulaceae archaeon PtaB.Bin152]|nr:MAG: hypothetical protein A4E39_00473 [Methanoregulaceae archaeon PtaB.Bin152]